MNCVWLDCFQLRCQILQMGSEANKPLCSDCKMKVQMNQLIYHVNLNDSKLRAWYFILMFFSDLLVYFVFLIQN